MSRENVEAMRRAMQAVNGRNLDGFLALMGDDVEAVPLMSGIEGSYRGHDGMRRWWAAILDSFPDFAPEVLGARDHEDVVVATLRVTGRGATGDTPFESTLWHVSLWRRGKCSWWGVYDNERQALEAVGLSEQAMSRENVEVIRQAFAAWAAGDLEGLIASMDEELVTRRHTPMPDPGTWHGRAGALDLVAEWVENFDDFTMEAEEFIDADDHVVVRTLQGGSGTSGGVQVTGVVWFAFGLRNGRVITLDIYAARQQALEAVGLSE